MNKLYTIYDNTGAIICAGSCAEKDFKLQLDAFENAFILEAHSDPDEHYVKNGAVLDRRSMDVGYSVDGLTAKFLRLPVGCSVRAKGQSTVSDSHGVEIEFDSPGIYWVFLSLEPEYKRANLEVTVG